MWIRFIRTFALFTILVLSASCQADMPEHHLDAHKVGFYAGGVDTRTEMLPNGLSTAWESDDEIAVWAKNSSGTYTLNNQIFKTYGLDYERGFFSSTLSSAMPEGTYTYYCSYPRPLSASGTEVTFSVPSQQDGKVSGGADIMIASPVVHGALTPIPDPEDHSGMSMEMNRMMHQFRFYIPATDAKLQGAAVERIKLTFPSEVVGNVTFDLADPSRKGVLSNGSRDIELRLAEPITLADQNYACVAFCPASFAEGEMLQVKAYTSDRIVVVDPIDLCARDFQAGHSTPVKLKVKEVTGYPYNLVFKVAANNLGEKPNTITLTAPSGCIWTEGGSNVFTYSPGRKIEVGEEIAFRFEDVATFRAFSGKSIAVTYDSDNALLNSNVSIQDLTSTDNANISLTVPYLFFEDFSGIPSFNDGHDNPKVGTSSDTYKGISELSSNSLVNWYGTRIGGQSGTSLRICCRYEHVLVSGAYYKGRVYTPFLSNIKDGKDVNITVSFRYGSNRSERDPLLGSPPKKSALLYFGVNTQQTVTNPDESEGDILDSITGMIAGSGFSSSAPTSLNPMAIKGEKMSTQNGSYTSFEGTKNVTIENVDNGMRLAWIVSTDNTSSNTNGNYWLYLDDIKVQIANQ